MPLQKRLSVRWIVSTKEMKRKKIRHKLRNWIFCRIHMRNVRKSWYCIGINCQKIKKILIQDFRCKYKTKGEEYIKKLAIVVSKSTIFDSLPAGYEDFCDKEKEVIAYEVTEAIKRDQIKELHLANLRIAAYSASFSKELHDKYFDKAKEIDVNVEPLSGEELRKTYKELVHIGKKIMDEDRLDKLAQAEKIEITSQRITTLIALFSGFFLSTGIIYNQIFLRYFAIDPSNFFSISDYLSTSAGKIYYSVISIIVNFGLILLLFPEYIYGEFPKPLSKHEETFNRVWFPLLTTLMALAAVINYFLNNREVFVQSLMGFIFLGAILGVSKIIMYFKDPARAYLLITTTLLFLLVIIFGAISDINHILHDDLHEIKNYKITFSSNLEVDEKNLVTLASTNNWFFFYDKGTEQTLIIPSENVIVIESSKKADSVFYNLFIGHFLQDRGETKETNK